MIAPTPRIVAYSSYFGDPEPYNQGALGSGEGYDRVLFTDRDDLTAPGIRIVKCDSRALGPALESRRAKMLPHRFFGDHDWAIYVDNRASLTENPHRIIAAVGASAEAGLFVFRHPERDSPADELDICLQLGHVDRGQWRRLHDLYRDTRMPATLDLTHNAVMIHRLGNPRTEAMLELWWELFLVHARRDQLTMQLAEHISGQSAIRLPFPLADIADWPVFQPSQRAATSHTRDMVKPSAWTLAGLRYRKERWQINRAMRTRDVPRPKG
jgi:hypothetical protein